MKQAGPKLKLRLKIFFISLTAIVLPTGIAVGLGLIPPNSLLIVYLLTALTFALIASIAITHQIISPLKQIISATEDITHGNISAHLDIRTNDEIEQLANSFNAMTRYLNQVFKSLEHSCDISSTEKNKLKAILSSIVDGIIVVDLSRKVLMANSAAENITGYSSEEMTKQPIDQFIHIFNKEGEIPPTTYCPTNFNLPPGVVYNPEQPLTLTGKNGKQVMIRLAGTQIAEGVQTDLGCILVFRDLTREKELEQMKLDFVSMASHELRTPLTSIIGYLTVFLDENKAKMTKDQADLLERSLVSAKQLLVLVGNMLSVNKIERDQVSVSTEPLVWLTQISKVVQDLQTQAKQKNIELKLAQPQIALPKVMADPLRINEVLNNLIANAINYTNPGGQVTISIQTTPNEVITTITDTGIGIPKEALPHLFNKFFRVSNTLQQGSKGTGLGLYISKSIITKLNGRIWVESEPGKGSKFSFSLPVAPGTTVNNQQFIGQQIQAGALNY